MHTLFRAWSIWLVSLIIKECQSVKCQGPIWNNCTCTDFRDVELLCPFLENYEIELKITKKKSIDLQCVTGSANYADLIPKINISGYQSLSIRFCDTYKKFGDVLKKLHIKNLKRLYFDNMPYTDKSMPVPVTNITKELFSSLETLEKLSFSYSNVQFSKDFLSNTPELLYLILTRVYLRGIDINLNYVPKLRRLHLSMNQISTIPNGTFKNMVNLTNLHLDNNNLKYINRTTLTGLKNLKLLDLSRNNIQDLTEDCFAELNSLAYLSIEKNEIKNLYSRMFQNNILLRVVTLQSNKLTDVPEDLFRNCEKLEELYLGDNKLRFLPETMFSNLKNLKTLDISANEFSILPENILSPLVSLKSLDVSFNKLSSFDLNAVYNFRDFKLLLSHNKIRRYPKAIGIRMKKLDLSFNEIEHVEIQEIIASSASNVDLRNNKIQLVDFSLPTNLLKQSIDTQISVQLENNPIACNCSNYDLIRYNNGNLKDVNAFVDISQEKLRCPGTLNLITTINPDALLCPVAYDCPRPCNCFYKPHSGDVIVNCASLNLTVAPLIPEAINLTGSDLQGKPIEGEVVANVTHLDLSGNHISEIRWIPRYLKILDLSNNKLNNLDKNVVSTLRELPNLDRVYVENNPWKCNCESFELQRYIAEYYWKVNSSDIYCHNIDEKLVNVKHLCLSSIDISILLSLLFGVFLCISVAVAIFYRYERNIRIYLKTKDICRWIFSKDYFEKGKEYDVFLSYSHQDEQFVIDSLLSELESGQKPFKICIHNRDWIPGKLITEQIVSSVENSRKTLIVLSNNFLESVWGKTEFRFAHSRALSEDRRILIVVIYGEINEEKLDDELGSYIKSNTYIKWGEPYFWSKLRGAIGHSRN